MPIVIRQIIHDGFENHIELAGDSWDLRTQIETLEEWLSANADGVDPSKQWVADLGFTVRQNAAGGGPPITRRLTELCIALNVEVLLSEYGLETDSGDS